MQVLILSITPNMSSFPVDSNNLNSLSAAAEEDYSFQFSSILNPWTLIVPRFQHVLSIVNTIGFNRNGAQEIWNWFLQLDSTYFHIVILAISCLYSLLIVGSTVIMLELPVITKVFLFVAIQLLLIIFIVNLGLLASTLFSTQRGYISRFLLVSFGGGTTTILSKLEIASGFVLAITALPVWLYLLEYNLQCQIHHQCVMPLGLLKILSDMVCGNFESTCEENLTIHQAFMICCPSLILTLTPGIISAILSRYCIVNSESCSVKIAPVAPPIFILPQKQ